MIVQYRLCSILHFHHLLSLNKLVERLRVSIEDNDITLAIKDCETLLKELKGRANTTLLKMGLPWYV